MGHSGFEEIVIGRPIGLWACGLLKVGEEGKGKPSQPSSRVLPEHVVLQHHEDQGHNRGPHVPLGCGLRPNDYAEPLEVCLRRLWKLLNGEHI